MLILDTNPFAWELLSGTLSLKQAVANLLVLINAHLAINHANQIAVIASHCDGAPWLYPTPAPRGKYKSNASANGTSSSRNHFSGKNHNSNYNDASGVDRNSEDGDDSEAPENNEASSSSSSQQQQHHHPNTAANKYCPFETVEREVLSNLSSLLELTTPSSLSANPTSTMIAGALTTALTYISKVHLSLQPGADGTGNPTSAGTTSPNNYYNNSNSSTTVLVDANDGTFGARPTTLTARILVVSVSGDLAGQYIPVMNAVFAAQRQRVPIDILKLAGDTVFLQQATDATGGVYMAPKSPEGLLLHLMMAYLPDQTCRQWLVAPTEAEVDFRAACFCHRNVVRIGYVCSVCLSSMFSLSLLIGFNYLITSFYLDLDDESFGRRLSLELTSGVVFCSPLEDSTCLTCGTALRLSSNVIAAPVIVSRENTK